MHGTVEQIIQTNPIVIYHILIILRNSFLEVLITVKIKLKDNYKQTTHYLSKIKNTQMKDICFQINKDICKNSNNYRKIKSKIEIIFIP